MGLTADELRSARREMAARLPPLISDPVDRDLVRQYLACRASDARWRLQRAAAGDERRRHEATGALNEILDIWLILLGEQSE
jgi:hypothetical protein